MNENSLALVAVPQLARVQAKLAEREEVARLGGGRLDAGVGAGRRGRRRRQRRRRRRRRGRHRALGPLVLPGAVDHLDDLRLRRVSGRQVEQALDPLRSSHAKRRRRRRRRRFFFQINVRRALFHLLSLLVRRNTAAPYLVEFSILIFQRKEKKHVQM